MGGLILVGVTLLATPTHGTVVLNRDGTFTYTPAPGATTDSFTYCANGSVTGTTCSSGKTALVTLGAAAAMTTKASIVFPTLIR